MRAIFGAMGGVRSAIGRLQSRLAALSASHPADGASQVAPATNWRPDKTIRGSCVIVGLALGTGGCAIHPLPEHVTGYDTWQIVNKIRCEARDAIERKAIALLAASPSPKTRALAQQLLDGTMSIKNFNRSRLDPTTRFFVEKYDETAIAYDFTFDMTENNDMGAEANLFDPFFNGVFRLNLKADNNRQRQNIRNFRVADTFGELLNEDLNCSDANVGKNYLYPISGTIGLAEMIRTFIDLNESQHLTPRPADKVPTLADTFDFQTTIGGSATPRVELSPVGRGFQLANAQLTGSAKRKDIHKVIIALSLAPDPEAARFLLGSLRQGLVRTQIVGPRITPAKVRALDEIDNQINRNFISETTRLRQRLDALP